MAADANGQLVAHLDVAASVGRRGSLMRSVSSELIRLHRDLKEAPSAGISTSDTRLFIDDARDGPRRKRHVVALRWKRRSKEAGGVTGQERVSTVIQGESIAEVSAVRRTCG